MARGGLSRVRPVTMVISGILCALISYLLAQLLLMWGRAPLEATSIKAIIIALLGVVILIYGYGVKTYKEGKNPRMSAVGAMRVAAFAQSCIVLGACAIGWMIGQFGLALGIWDSHIGHVVIFNSVIGLIASIFLLVSGRIVEGWCTVDGCDEDKNRDSRSEGGMAAA